MNDTSLSISDSDGNNLVKIDVGTLAIIVLAVVSGCCVLMMLGLYVWNRLQTSSNLRCCRCHQVIAIQGVRLPPVLHMNYNVVVQQFYPPLEVSELGQTIVTTGHIPDLVDIERMGLP